ENPEVGVKFLYSRRWRLALAENNQIRLDTPEGHGLLITVEPEARMPTAAAYQRENRDWVEKQRGKVRGSTEPRPLAGATGVEHFSMEAELEGQAAQMDYYIVRQPGGGGALVAVRLGPMDLREVRAEAEKIVRGLTVMKR